MDPLEPISDEGLPGLSAELAEVARADRQAAGQFVPPRIGILEERRRPDPDVLVGLRRLPWEEHQEHVVQLRANKRLARRANRHAA